MMTKVKYSDLVILASCISREKYQGSHIMWPPEYITLKRKESFYVLSVFDRLYSTDYVSSLRYWQSSGQFEVSLSVKGIKFRDFILGSSVHEIS
jgi:hypothetical protein